MIPVERPDWKPVTILLFKDTHREKEPSNKNLALRKTSNMGVWTVGTLN